MAGEHSIGSVLYRSYSFHFCISISLSHRSSYCSWGAMLNLRKCWESCVPKEKRSINKLRYCVRKSLEASQLKAYSVLATDAFPYRFGRVAFSVSSAFLVCRDGSLP